MTFTANTIGAEILTPLIGEAGPIRSANYDISRTFFIRRASPISGVKIAAPIVLALHKGQNRIGEARTPICSASPIVTELTYKLSCTGRKRKYADYKMTTQ